MPHAMSQTGEDIISGILNWVCPECGGRMGGRTKEFKCQGECQTDWRDVWERRVGKPGKKANSPRALGEKYKDYATTEAPREAQL
jgi:tRNA(Ile2) C34 agmatinyltransferase TiaS